MARQPKSPWQRHGKVKYAYSTTYQLWREAVVSGGAGSQKALALSCQHAKAMGVVNASCVDTRLNKETEYAPA